MEQLVSSKLEDGVATIIMDDGKANALSTAMWEQLGAAFDEAQEAGAIVILTGRQGVFSGGFDLKEMAQGPEQAIQLTARGSKMARRILSFPTPVIGVASGHCIAMGAFLMLACDYRIALAGDFKVGLNETMIGMTMHRFGIELARHRLPANYFNRCVINAEIFSAENAINAGFYDCAVAPEQLQGKVDEVVATFGQLNMKAFNGTKNKSRKDFLALVDRCIEDDLEISLV